jgi:hypothetical protein
MHSDRVRPVPGGVSVGNRSTGATGTLGVRVIDANTGDELLLSNEHVFERSGKIIQPGLVDGGNAGDDIGDVLRGSDLSLGHESKIDAAVARATTTLDPAVLEIGEIAGVMPPEVGMPVWKSGRTTQLTKGTITDTNAVLNVVYDVGPIRLIDLIFFKGDEPVVMGGDSGSLLVTYDGNGRPYAVGLVFAGPANKPYNYGVACKIQNVLDALAVVIPTASSDMPVQVKGAITDIETLQGIPNAYISINGMTTATDSIGNYQIGIPAPGRYTLRIRARGYNGGDIEANLVDGENVFSFALTPRGNLSVPVFLGVTAAIITITGVITE